MLNTALKRIEAFSLELLLLLEELELAATELELLELELKPPDMPTELLLLLFMELELELRGTLLLLLTLAHLSAGLDAGKVIVPTQRKSFIAREPVLGEIPAAAPMPPLSSQENAFT